MRVLVTGGTGYLGSAVARALSGAGHTPVIFARRASRSGLAGELVDGDVRDRGAVFSAARGVDAICHTAALVSVWRPRRADFDDVNVAGFEGVLDVCRAQHIPRLVYTSSFLALPPADGTRAFAANDYQRTKIAAREIARRAAREGVPIVCLYPGVVYGPGAVTDGNLVGRLVRDHLAGQLPGLVGASRPWSFTHLDDVAAAHVAALTTPAPAPEYVVGGDNAPPMRLFEILREVRNRPLPRRIPFAVAELVAVLEEARAALSGRPPRLTRGVVRIFRHDWSLDGRPAAASLGYTITSLERGFRALLDGWGG